MTFALRKTGIVPGCELAAGSAHIVDRTAANKAEADGNIHAAWVAVLSAAHRKRTHD